MTRQEIENRFTYHAPIGNQPQRYDTIRSLAKEVAFLIEDTCPESREKALAFTHLEAAVMWANAAIARNEDPSTAVVESRWTSFQKDLAAWNALSVEERIEELAKLPALPALPVTADKKIILDAVVEQARQLCYSVERLPAGEQQTALSLEASKLQGNIHKIVAAMT